ncbi:MAG: hypothetical protein WBD88_00045 [Mycobacterium sp.]|jgi:hypothetical protein
MLRTLALAAAVAGLLAVFVTIPPLPEADADVCAGGGGRRVNVSGCANLSDVMAPYVVPPAAYAPLPAVSGCVGYDGRWISGSACN